MRVLSDRQLPPWMIVSDALFNAVKASRFIAPHDQPEVARITAEPRMPKITVRYPPYGWRIFLDAGLNGVVDLRSADGGRRTGKTVLEDHGYDLDAWLKQGQIERASALTARGIIRHKWKAREDRLGTNTLELGTAAVNQSTPGLMAWSELHLDFFDEFQGGELTVVSLFLLPASFVPGFPLLAAKVTQKIRGENPVKRSVRGYIDATVTNVDDAWALKVIAWKESKFRQFFPPNYGRKKEGMPYASADGTAMGVMQLKNLGKKAGNILRPSPREIWHWKANVDAGVRLYRQKQGTVRRHYRGILAKDEKAAASFAKQFKNPYRDFYRYAFYQLYYSGYYWRWTGSTWSAGANSAYGRELARVEDGLRATKPVAPREWD